MKPHVNAITIGVEDIDRAKTFYADGMGWPIQADHGQFVQFGTAEGSSTIALYPRQALADDAGVPPDGSGFRGVTFNYFVSSDDLVDAVLAQAERAGGRIVKPAERAKWGGYSGHFADPDGYLWKVVIGSPGQPVAE